MPLPPPHLAALRNSQGGRRRIAAHFHLSPVAPFIVDADVTPAAAGWPRGGTTECDLPNNHLNYALNSFGLAVGLLAVFMAFVVGKFAEASGS